MHPSGSQIISDTLKKFLTTHIFYTILLKTFFRINFEKFYALVTIFTPLWGLIPSNVLEAIEHLKPTFRGKLFFRFLIFICFVRNLAANKLKNVVFYVY